MPGWKKIYSRSLEMSYNLYVSGDFIRLERLLDIMQGQIHDDEALQELKEFTERVDELYQAQMQAVDTEASKKTNPIGKSETYGNCDRVLDWRLYQLLRFHQDLAKKYSLLPP